MINELSQRFIGTSGFPHLKDTLKSSYVDYGLQLQLQA